MILLPATAPTGGLVPDPSLATGRGRGSIRRRPAKPGRLVVVALVGLGLLLAGCSTTGVPSVGVTVGDGQTATGGGQFALSLQLLIALTVLSVVPAILLMATSFTRIIVVLSLLRSAIGIPQLPPNQVLLGLALFLTMFIMGPVWSRINTDALQPYLAGTIPAETAIAQGTKPLREFMLRQTSEADLAVFLEMSQGPRPKTVADVPTEALLPAFVMSELRTAFTMGFLLFVPFLVIDLVVASALMSMGMVMVSPTQIALPFKILLFVLVDGWVLIVQSLVKSFA
jgi:flagellar biosynthetic protein FliP